ncbi:hypothetical protein LINPERHAP2_LOCUS34806 [Linum perenne]
MGRGKGNPTG